MIVKIKVSPCRDRHAHAVSVDEYKFLPFQKTTIVGSSLSNYERQETCLRARIGRVEKTYDANKSVVVKALQMVSSTY